MWGKLLFMKLLIMQFSQARCYPLLSTKILLSSMCPNTQNWA